MMRANVAFSNKFTEIRNNEVKISENTRSLDDYMMA